MKEKNIEILAPAGSYESLIAAIHAGADAVYIGGSKFGARAFADNLKEEDMLKVIDYVHLHGKKIYLTVNTLLKNKELEEELYYYLEKFYIAGLDAVIVQDVGVLHYIHQYFPQMPIHASTQMTLTMAGGAKMLSHMGVTRMVTPRELNLSEIKEIKENTSLEIESFVHGALCYCYSGQCLMSSMIGGRSGNRGRCAQPCRMPYELSGREKTKANLQEKYLLSPKDICTLSMIPELVESGIDSFKIEGRMKRAEYTALVVSKYRKYADLYLKLGKDTYEQYIVKYKEKFDEDIQELMDLYNRGSFTDGYYHTHNGKNMMSVLRPNHNGVLVGTVIGIKGISAQIKLEQDINSQDILEIRNGQEGIYEFTVKNPAKKNTVLSANFLAKSGVSKGQSVYRTKNQNLLEEIQKSYIEIPFKEKMQGVFAAEAGKPIRLILECNAAKIEVNGPIAESALKQSTDVEQIKKQLNKTNSTEFIFDTLKIETGENLFLPSSHLNELRRKGIEQLENAILSRYRREKSPLNHTVRNTKKGNIGGKYNKENQAGMIAHLTDTRLLDIILESKETDIVYIDMTDIKFEEIGAIAAKVRERAKAFYLVLPHIFRKNTADYFKEKAEYLLGDVLNKIDGFIVKNFEELDFLKEELNIAGNQIRLDYNVYTANKESKEFYREKGINRFTACAELNDTELKAVGCEDSDLIVYGYLPVMVSAQCTYKTLDGCRRAENLSWGSYLVDRYHKKFYVKSCCRFCYSVIYNGQPLFLLKNEKEIRDLKPENIRLDFTMESEKEAAEILRAFADVFRLNKANTYEIKDYTRGHFKRGVD